MSDDSTAQAWWASFFDEDYRRAAAPMLSEERTEEEADGLLELLADLDDRALILDVCGGDGRVASALARRGARAIVADLSPEMLAAGRARPERTPYVRADARALPFQSGRFDVALNLFSSFGYFDSDDEHVVMLRSIARVIKPGGRFVMVLTHRDHFLMTLEAGAFSYALEDGTEVERAFSFDPITGRSHERLTLTRDAEVLDKRWVCRIFTATEIARMLREAGLMPEAWFGDFDLQPFTIDTPRLIVVARKPTDDQGSIMTESPTESWRDVITQLACPQTGAPLQLMNTEPFASLLTAVGDGRAKTLQGDVVSGDIDAALRRVDGDVAYPVRGDIPQLLIAEAIDLRSFNV